MMKGRGTRNTGARNKSTSSSRSVSGRASGFSASRSGNDDWGRVRLVAVGVFFGLLWAALWARAWYVQVSIGPELAQKASRQHVATELVAGKRGEIFDRNGQKLASSIESMSVFVRPVELTNRDHAVRVLSDALGMPYATVARQVQGHRRFAWVKRRISDKAAAVIRDAAVKGVYLTTEYVRQYPNRQLAGKLLGFVGLDDRGLEGLELSFEDRLSGQESRQEVQRDAAGRRLYLHGAELTNKVEGEDLRLTIDAQIQYFAEEALADAVTTTEASWGGAVVVKAKSGEILAWAEYPSFNPNAYNHYKPAQWRNRIATDALEPGSTVKPFLIAAALEEGLVQPDNLYFCEDGKWKLHNVYINDTHKYEWLTVDNILRYSSNIGVAKIGLELGARKYSEYLTRLGFGERTGVPVGGESKGILRPFNTWREVDLATAAFGQGFSTTLLQLAQAYVCLANGGVKKPLRLVLNDMANERTETRVFSEQTASAVLSMMRGVVEEDGTGRGARIPGLTIGGKTGTAQKASTQGGYGEKRTGSFVGLVPAEDPEYIVIVVVDEPQTSPYGSVVAVPAFRNITMQSLAYLGTLPDAPEIVQVADATAAASARSNTVSSNGRMAGAAGNVEIRREIHREAVVHVSGGGSTVPDVCGMSLRRAVEAFARKGIIPKVEGNGLYVKRQVPSAGSKWPEADATEYVLYVSEQS